jgi:hypothetical protein
VSTAQSLQAEQKQNKHFARQLLRVLHKCGRPYQIYDALCSSLMRTDADDVAIIVTGQMVDPSPFRRANASTVALSYSDLALEMGLEDCATVIAKIEMATNEVINEYVKYMEAKAAKDEKAVADLGKVADI